MQLRTFLQNMLGTCGFVVVYVPSMCKTPGFNPQAAIQKRKRKSVCFL